MEHSYFNVGKIVNTHGIRGELKVFPQTDFPDMRFAKGSVLYAFPPDGSGPVELKLVSSRVHKGHYLILAEGYEDINLVEKFKGGMLKIRKDQLHPLPEGEYYYHEIIGCSVYLENGEEIGRVSAILTPGAHDVWVIERNRAGKKDVLIPVVKDVVKEIDPAGKKIVIHALEGLLEVYEN